MNMDDLLEKYISELGEDTKLDEFSTKERQLQLPGLKHKWVGRLMRHKMSFSKLEDELNSTIESFTDEAVAGAAFQVSRAKAKSAILNHSTIKGLKNKIKNEEIIIEFLEKVERVMTSMSFDIKNIVEIMKLETL